MAVLYGTNSANLASTPAPALDGDVMGGRVRVYADRITLATQTTSDTIVIARVPAGSAFLFGMLTASVSLGTSTVAIGITGTTGKYRAAATFTAVDTPTPFGDDAATNVKITTQETIFITIAVASLPGSGTLATQLFFASS